MTAKTSLVEQFKDAYGRTPTVIARAPGRLEILGNHTDYNEGLVLSAAVDQATEFALCPKTSGTCCLKDFRDGSFREFDLASVDSPTENDWSNYVKGIVSEIRKSGHDVEPFDAGILSTVPLSAGMSSSAALEMSAAFAFSRAFGIELPKEEWARLGQKVENNYVGIQSGLLDQFSSVFGKKDSVILCDFRKVSVERTVSIPRGWRIVVVNTMVKHNLVESDYNLRRQSCENAVESLKADYPSIHALRDVSMEMLVKSKETLDITDYRRALHVVGENQRVTSAVQLLENNDIEGFGKLLYESHQSSKENFENSCPELDYLVELSMSIPGCIGARLSGGGFGGITIHLVEDQAAEAYCQRIQSAYKLQTGIDTETIICSFGEGVTVTALS